MKARTGIAFLVAPALLPVAVFGTVAVIDPSRGSIQAGAAYAVMFSAFTYGIALLFGVPLAYWYRQRGWFAVHHYAFAGALLGLLPLFPIALFGRIPLALPPVMAAVGSLSAVVFWLIAGRQSPKTHVA